MYVVVFVTFITQEHQGLGIGHFYYVAVALAALAGGVWAGASAGVLAAGLYAVGVVISPQLATSSVPTYPTLIRAITFVLIGTLMGWFATNHRRMFAELTVLAERDVLTGLPNTRAFEAAITRQLERARPFALLVADFDSLAALNGDVGRTEGDDALRRLADLLSRSLEPEDELARIGGDEFAVLTTRRSADDARDLAGQLERVLAGSGFSITFGWASYPHDGNNALSLYRAADERLYARKLVRGRRRGTLSAAGLEAVEVGPRDAPIAN